MWSRANSYENHNIVKVQNNLRPFLVKTVSGMHDCKLK